MKRGDFKKMKPVSEIRELGDFFDTRVATYYDESTGSAYQVDDKRPRYREADGKNGGAYGQWKPLED